MKNIDNLTIICPACGSTFRREGAVLGDGWLYTCENCGQQSIVSDEMLAEARQAGRMEIKGQPLGSPRTATQAQKGESPLVADARRRADETVTTNPLIENAKKRAGKAQEVHSNV